MMHEPLTFHGCKPTPLASYLKALGVLRLLSSDANHVDGRAADLGARGWWENEQFRLMTRLKDDDVLSFFLEHYAPSPITAPWNGGSGFYPNDNKDGFEPLISATVAPRFSALSHAIRDASRVIKRRELTERPDGQVKVELAAEIRAGCSNSALDWVDAVLVLSGDRLAYPPLLGTGGNDRRLDFTNNFMRRLVSKKKPLGLFDAESGRPLGNARSLLESALFDSSARGIHSAAIGQFAPDRAGGPNMTVGSEAHARINPWDFVLMLEGAVAFGGSASRRHQGATESGASFPFMVHMVGAGWGGTQIADENNARREFWAPLWGRPARFQEMAALLAEGRAVSNRRAARDGLAFARAVVSLGMSRGFYDFERYGFLMRAGKTYFATPMGRFSVPQQSRRDLIEDLEVGGWLEQARRLARGNSAPASTRSAMHRLEDALFQMTDTNLAAASTCNALIALGKFVNTVAISSRVRETLRPPPLLSAAWIKAADDNSPELRIAVALAGLGLPPPKAHCRARPDAQSGAPDLPAQSLEASKTLPMASHLVPLDEDGFFDGKRLRRIRRWSQSATVPNAVWGAGSLASNMISVLERRLVERGIHGLDDKPLAGSVHSLLGDVAVFLSGDFDDARCTALLAGLIWACPARLRTLRRASMPVPFAFAVIKPVFAPDRTLRRVGAIADTARLPIPSGLISLLRAGGSRLDGKATDAAARVALARARASGVPSPFDPARSGGRTGAGEGFCMGVGLPADRLAAALLIPVGDNGLRKLINRAYPGAIAQHKADPKEVTTDAA